MEKALILGTNRNKNGEATLFICYYWDGSEWVSFHYSKEYRTLAGAKRGLKKMGFNEIEVEI